jgi:hypothetical protein
VRATALPLLLLGCGYISRAERDARWDLDGDGVERPDDCDDLDATVSPSRPESCEPTGLDEDCDGLADELDPDCPGTLPTDTGPTDTGPGSACGDLPVARLSVGEGVSEVGGGAIVADGSASTGLELLYRYDWGDGVVTGPGAEPVSEHLYPVAGWFSVALEVEDPCGRTASDEAWVAVAEAGQLLRVSTAADEADTESWGTAPLGSGLSLREALALAAGQPGAQLVTFQAGLGPVSVGPNLPALEDPAEMLVGRGVILEGSAGGWLEVQGEGAIVAGLELAGFTDERYGALRLMGGALAQGLTVRDSAVGVVLDGPGSELRDSVLRANRLRQVVVSAEARLQGLVIAGGEGVGIWLSNQADGSELRLCQVLDHASSGIELADDADSISIFDSTVVDNGGDGITSGKRVGSLALRNVILAFNGGHGLGGEVDSFAQGSPSHDVWFDNTLGDCPPCSTLGLGSLTVDPELADVEAGDLAPLRGSPALDAGTVETQTDKNGPSEGHHHGEAPEIGAVEVP